MIGLSFGFLSFSTVILMLLKILTKRIEIFRWLVRGRRSRGSGSTPFSPPSALSPVPLESGEVEGGHIARLPFHSGLPGHAGVSLPAAQAGQSPLTALPLLELQLRKLGRAQVDQRAGRSCRQNLISVIKKIALMRHM